MNGKWQMAKWVSDEWQAPVGKPPCNTPLPPISTCPTCSEKPAYLCCAYCCHSRPQTPLSQGVRTVPTFPFPASEWNMTANRKYLCIMQSEMRRSPNNGNLLSGKSNFRHSHKARVLQTITHFTRSRSRSTWLFNLAILPTPNEIMAKWSGERAGVRNDGFQVPGGSGNSPEDKTRFDIWDGCQVCQRLTQ